LVSVVHHIRPSCLAEQSLCTQGLPNPFKGVPGFEGTGFYTNNTRSRCDLNRAFPQFNTSLNEYMRNDGSSWYNSLQAAYNLRLRAGINLNTNYTFAKNVEQSGYLDNLKNVMQRGITSYDRPHKFVFSMIGQLPFGERRRWFSGARSDEEADQRVGGHDDISDLLGQAVGPAGQRPVSEGCAQPEHDLERAPGPGNPALRPQLGQLEPDHLAAIQPGLRLHRDELDDRAELQPAVHAVLRLPGAARDGAYDGRRR
jgi:hypothetical protein